MRATEILQEALRDGAEIVHAKQWAQLWRGVGALVEGGQLWLTALARSLPAETSDKHRIKAVDRLLGNVAIQGALPRFYAVIAAFLLRDVRRPIIAVDWTSGGSSHFYILCASLCFKGRALPIWSRTFPTKRKCSPIAEREFLNELVSLMPSHCRPILVTDAGFHTEWFDALTSIGWDFVGRIRGTKKVLRGNRLVPLEELHALGGRRPQCLGTCYLRTTRNKVPRPFRLVLSARPQLKGRHRITSLGTKGKRTADRQRSQAAREPLLLVTSLTSTPTDVVAVYPRRMQIEETFRDLKSHRYGWSLDDMRSRTAARVEVLLLIAALATLAMHMVGFAAQTRDLQRPLQANTERKRAVFSTFYLAKLIIQKGLQTKLQDNLLSACLTQIRDLALQAAHTK